MSASNDGAGDGVRRADDGEKAASEGSGDATDSAEEPVDDSEEGESENDDSVAESEDDELYRPSCVPPADATQTDCEPGSNSAATLESAIGTDAIVVQRVVEPVAGPNRVGTVRVLSAGRTVTSSSSSTALLSPSRLWVGRQLGEWTAQEHQQLALGLLTYGTARRRHAPEYDEHEARTQLADQAGGLVDWERIQRLMVPSRSVDEIRRYAHRHLRDRLAMAPLPPLVPPPPGGRRKRGLADDGHRAGGV